jgi:hypothetical protein
MYAGVSISMHLSDEFSDALAVKIFKRVTSLSYSFQ